MQRQLSSFKIQLIALILGAAACGMVLTGLAVVDAPPWLMVAVGTFFILILALVAARLCWKIHTATQTLSAALARLAQGEQMALSPTFEEEHEIAAGLSALSTELKRRVREAQRNEERYRVLAESLPAMVWLVDAEGRTLFQNRRVSDYTGEPFQAGRQTYDTFIHPDDRDRLRTWRRQARDLPLENHLEIRLRRHDGVHRWHALTTAPLGHLLEDVGQASWVATAVDIEDLKQAEELQARLATVLEQKVTEATDQLRDETNVRRKAERQLRLTQKMEAITRLTGGIAHDLNNKLMVISANIDAVTKQIKDQPQLRRKLIAALVGSDQAAGLISKLLAFARQRDLQVQYIDIAEHLESITSLLDRSFMSESVQVQLSIPEDLWPVEVDPHELETAIVNLGRQCPRRDAGGRSDLDRGAQHPCRQGQSLGS